MNSLDGGPISSGVPMESSGKFADLIDSNEEKYIEFCEKLGAKKVPGGDISFEFEIYKGLKALIKFYEKDDEFNASAAILFEKRMLQFVNYETVFYIASDLQHLISEGVKE